MKIEIPKYVEYPEISRFIAWINDPNLTSVSWDEFQENYTWCSECESFTDGPCVCFLR